MSRIGSYTIDKLEQYETDDIEIIIMKERNKKQ